MPRGKRKDLGCPFGCSEAHGKQQSTRRSVAYYQSKEGRDKKRDLNQRRSAPSSLVVGLTDARLAVRMARREAFLLGGHPGR